MKLSAILISVNLVAAPLAATAADQNINNKDNWLQQSLSSLEHNSKPATRKLSLSDHGVKPKTRMMPFVPGRPLPHLRDLELAYERAHMDNSLATKTPINLVAQEPILGNANGQLSGQISAYALQLPARSQASRSLTDTNQAHAVPRTVPDQILNLPGQVAASRQPVLAHPIIPEPPEIASQATTNLQSTLATRRASPMPTQIAALSAETLNMFDQLKQLPPPQQEADSSIQSSLPAAILADPATASTAGPPPFPFNLLPQEALHEFIGRRKQQRAQAIQPSRFGSWQQSNLIANLPPAGFHSNITHSATSGAQFRYYTPATRNLPTRTKPKSKSQPASHYTSTTPVIMTYGSYETVARVSWF